MIFVSDDNLGIILIKMCSYNIIVIWLMIYVRYNIKVVIGVKNWFKFIDDIIDFFEVIDINKDSEVEE